MPAYTDALLDEMRQVGDPLADEAVAEVFALGQVGRANQLLRDLDQNNEVVPAELPPRLRRYFEAGNALPSWADTARIERGNDLLGRYAPQIVSILHCQSLPSCYAAAKGVRVLYLSQRITGQVFRRIMETAQFVLDVMEEGGLGPRGRGRRSAQKIRLLHATIRHHLRRDPRWRAAEWDLPINQEDLAGTLLSFSVVIPQGLARLGVTLPPADRDAFFHSWGVVGHLLGIDDRLLPRRFEDGAALWDRILERQVAPSEAGRVVTKALVDYMRDLLVGPALDGAPPTLIRHLCGDRLADTVGVPPADWTQLALQLQSGANTLFAGVTDRNALAAKLASQLGTVLLKGGVRASNLGRRYEWSVPESAPAGG